MPDDQETYTYRNGEKVLLEKAPDQFVVRVLPENLESLGIMDAEQVSSHSSKVTTRATDLEPEMSRLRHVAPTHHAYSEAATGADFLITDRVLVTFKEALPAEQIDAFAARYGVFLKTAYSDRDFLFQLTDHTGINPVKLIVKLNEDEPLVEVAEHDLNHKMQTYAVPIPTDTSYLRQWHLHRRLNDTQFDHVASVTISWEFQD